MKLRRELEIGTGSHKGGGGGRARRGKEPKHQIRLVVARVRGRARAVWEALPSEELEVGRVSAAQDVQDAELVFGQQVAPTRLVMTDVTVVLLLQPLQAGIVDHSRCAVRRACGGGGAVEP